MLTDVVKVTGNYTIRANNGTVTVNAPETFVTGNLRVDGDVIHLGTWTSITVQDTIIRDNLITLNSGEVGTGITADGNFAGLKIARGNNDANSVAAFFVYQEDTFTTQFGTAEGIWQFGDLGQVGQAIRVSAIVTPPLLGTLTIFGSFNPDGMISVKGTTDYHLNVTDDDDIPNKRYVDNLIGTSELAKKLIVGNTFIQLGDNSISTTTAYYTTTNKIVAALGGAGNVVLKLEGTSAQFYGLELLGTRIRAVTNNTNISIEPSGTGTVFVSSGIQLLNYGGPSVASGYTGIFSTSTVGAGGTGLYYVNNIDSDELVSKRRSIIYGIIF